MNSYFLLEKYSIMPKQIILKTQEGVEVLKTKDICFIKSHKNYLHFFMNDEKTYISRATIESYEKLLKRNQFLRTHKSFLVNTRHITNICTKTCCITLVQNKKVPISHRKKGCITDWLLTM